jgi:Putative MetA-pathway of phenol degradation
MTLKHMTSCKGLVAVIGISIGGEMQSRLAAVAAACALSMCMGMSTALAGSVTQPGETAGVPAGEPLPEGLYFANTADWGCRNTSPTRCLGITIPIVTWSTPWTLLGARVQLLAVAPFIEIGMSHTSYSASVYNPALLGQLAWDLGNGFGFSYAFGAYFNVDQSTAWSSTSLNQRFALSYTANGWNLTANAIYGIQLDGVTNRPQISPCPSPFAFNGCNPDFLNVDLTATKEFGKWQLGPVAFGNTDLTRPIASYQKQSQFAAGGLVGYDFGPLTMQAYATTDVVEQNYGGRATRVWFRIVIPFWTPPALPQKP